MIDSSIMVGLISLVGTIIGSITGVLVSNKLTNYRIEQLEKKLDKYSENQVEMAKVQAVQKRDLETAFIRIDELKGYIRK